MTTQVTQLSIVRYGHPVLRERARKVGRVTPEVRQLAEQMLEVMRAAHGVGLAANQVAVPLQLAVVEVDDEVTVLIDPEILSARGAEAADEGCLSLPKLYGAVERPTNIVVKARNLSGKTVTLEAEGMRARAFSHEIDHLSGKLFVDQVDPSTLYWLLGHTGDGEPITQPTTLDDALRVFAAARAGRG